MPAAEYTCACGHVLDTHDRPRTEGEPWGGCRALVQNGLKMRRCDCREAWPMDPDDEGGTL